MLLPVGFPYWVFALLLAARSASASGMFASPNTSSIMSSVPAPTRGVASGMRATFQNSGTAISIGDLLLADDRRLARAACPELSAAA